MKVQFTKAYDYTPSGERRVQIAYSPDGGPHGDGRYTVKRECGDAAIAEGSARDMTFNGADPALFDHDKSGEPGGSMRGEDGEA